jgi:hypothetical protein
MASFQQHGGWWKNVRWRGIPDASAALNRTISRTQRNLPVKASSSSCHSFHRHLAEAGANKPWLQELPDPTTTVMWNTWLEMNPETAHELHIENDDVVRVVSEAGAVEVPVYLYPAIRPDTVAMPFGQGHTAYGNMPRDAASIPLICLVSISMKPATLPLLV